MGLLRRDILHLLHIYKLHESLASVTEGGVVGPIPHLCLASDDTALIAITKWLKNWHIKANETKTVQIKLYSNEKREKIEIFLTKELRKIIKFKNFMEKISESNI